jgi:hypothetical protein
MHALHDVVEEIDVGIGIFDILDGRADAVIVESWSSVASGVCSMSCW